MKKWILAFLMMVFYLVGCSNDSMVNPISTTNQKNYKLIQLPNKTRLETNTIYSVTEEICGDKGGTLNIQDCYAGGSYGKVTKNITVTFPEGAFKGTQKISMTVDDYNCTVDFYPSMSFFKSAIVNATYTGIDLKQIDASALKFVYLRDDGTYETLVYDGIVLDYSTGTITAKNVKINHFSRYGFVN
jgi:uncharacterized lipoprotein NlpE involved in copper resistance